MSVSYHNSWDQYGFNMALIWLRYGFQGSHVGVISQLSGCIQRIFREFRDNIFGIVKSVLDSGFDFLCKYTIKTG